MVEDCAKETVESVKLNAKSVRSFCMEDVEMVGKYSRGRRLELLKSSLLPRFGLKVEREKRQMGRWQAIYEPSVEVLSTPVSGFILLRNCAKYYIPQH